jgi:CheY-like chemotaxis protein
MSAIEPHARLVQLAAAQARPMIFLTGGVFDEDAERFLHTHQRWCVGKPFDPAELLALVARRIAHADPLALGTRMV